MALTVEGKSACSLMTKLSVRRWMLDLLLVCGDGHKHAGNAPVGQYLSIFTQLFLKQLFRVGIWGGHRPQDFKPNFHGQTEISV